MTNRVNWTDERRARQSADVRAAWRKGAYEDTKGNGLRYVRTSEHREKIAAVQAKDIAGQRYGRLIALERLGREPGKGYLWRCKCDCGGERILSTGSWGHVRSCGCLFREFVEGPRFHKRKRPFEYLYNGIRSGARARGITFDLTYEEFLPLTQLSSCEYCGAGVLWSEVSRSGQRSNLDRKDNNRGYELPNLAVCCWECNDAKGSRYTHGEWRAMAAALRSYRDTK